MPSVPSDQKPFGENDIELGEEQVFNAYATDYGQGSSDWSIEKLAEKIQAKIVSETNDGYELCFDLIGIEAPFANAVRRVLIAEVPSIAIEKVYLYQNTSLIQDEVLAHRLGLIPIKADFDDFDWPTPLPKTRGPPVEPVPNPKESIVFELNVSSQFSFFRGGLDVTVDFRFSGNPVPKL